MNKFIQNKRRNYMELQHPFGGLDKKNDSNGEAWTAKPTGIVDTVSPKLW